MEKIYITNIHVKKVRHLENLDIELSETEKKHLILTGKNGSGKTSLLDMAAKRFLMAYSEVYPFNYQAEINMQDPIYDSYIRETGLYMKFNLPVIDSSFMETSIFLYVKALRNLDIPSAVTVTKEADIIDKINKNKIIETNTSIDFLQRMVNLYFMQLSAENKKELEKIEILKKWFENFTNLLKKIYNCDTLKLEFDDDDFKHKIIIPNREPFALNEMSDGYSAALKIVMELINLMEAKSGKYCVYNMRGIVLIDEIETHLHVELQKEIMPILTTMFPNIQFIVSTHSPFIINSISNAVVFDLENKRRIEDLSAYSWETIVESYFEAGQYSHEITGKFNRYKKLYKKDRSHEEEKEFFRLRAELETVSPAQKELYNAFRQMEMNSSEKTGGQKW